MCKGLVLCMNEVMPTYVGHFKLSTLQLPASQGVHMIPWNMAWYIPDQSQYTCPTLVHTSNNWHHRGYWKLVPWYWSWNERTNQASMTLGNTNPLLLVLLVLGRDMR
jgi:hypothetical protein